MFPECYDPDAEDCPMISRWFILAKGQQRNPKIFESPIFGALIMADRNSTAQKYP
jgi:hypothetical protein